MSDQQERAPAYCEARTTPRFSGPGLAPLRAVAGPDSRGTARRLAQASRRSTMTVAATRNATAIAT